jgi:hypothetical protein
VSEPRWLIRRAARLTWRRISRSAGARAGIARISATLRARVVSIVTIVIALYLLLHAGARLIGSRVTAPTAIDAVLVAVLAIVVWRIGSRAARRIGERR